MERILSGHDWSRSLCKGLFKDSFYQGPYVKDSSRTRLVKDTIERILEGLVWSRTWCKGNTIKKPLVLQYPSEKVSKNHWFYRPGNRKRWKTIGFTVKRAPGNRATESAHQSGVCHTLTRWRTYEEPLQPSCLGNMSFWIFIKQTFFDIDSACCCAFFWPGTGKNG